MDVFHWRLDGRHVSLEPLTMHFFEELCDAGLHEEIWTWNTFPVRSREDMRRYILSARLEQRAGSAMPYAVVEKSSRRVIGSTRFGNIDRQNRRLEIGWTWITPAHQRTVANTECKYLLLSHAFDTLRAVRVEFKTDALNERSRRAIERLGAKSEGTLRHHMIAVDGRLRDTAYYSIVVEEWHIVRARLREMLELD
jgi:RimJ/RimL family protein N-acetyltransferase